MLFILFCFAEGYIGDVDVPVDVYTSSSSFGVEESTEVVVSLDETQLSTATEEPYHSEADIVDTGMQKDNGYLKVIESN